jgi:hypothetical protein
MILSLKYPLFIFHYLIVAYIIYPFSKYNTYLAICTYSLWHINNNYCILSQIEYNYFNCTSCSKNLNRISSKEKYLLLTSQFIKHFYNININLFKKYDIKLKNDFINNKEILSANQSNNANNSNNSNIETKGWTLTT